MHDLRPQFARAPFASRGGWVAAGMLVLVAVGCRNDGSQQDAYIRDLRMHEQQIYELQDYMTEYQELLRQQRKENARLREQLAARTNQIDDPADDDAGRSLLDGPTGIPGQRPEPLEMEDQDDLGLPNVDPGIPSVDPGIPSAEPGVPDSELGTPFEDDPIVPVPRTLREDETDGAEELPPGLGRAGAGRGRQARLESNVHGASFVGPVAAMQPATAVALYAEQISLEPVPGTGQQEIGLLAIVEPLTDTGAAGDFRGELSLMIVDPIAPADGDWEIARWDYTAEEVEQSWRTTARRVLDLPLAAPPETPVARPLELWIQMLPADGRERILARTMIELGPPVKPTSGGPSAREPGVASHWQAASQPYPAKARETTAEGSWKPSKHLPVAPLPSTPSEPIQLAQPPASAAPSWAPRR